MNRIRYRLEHPILGTAINHGPLPEDTTIRDVKATGSLLWSLPIEPGYSAEEIDRIIEETKVMR